MTATIPTPIGSAGFASTEPANTQTNTTEVKQFGIKYADGSFSRPMDSLDLARLYLASHLLGIVEFPQYVDVQIVERTRTRTITVEDSYSSWEFPKVTPTAVFVDEDGDFDLSDTYDEYDEEDELGESTVEVGGPPATKPLKPLTPSMDISDRWYQR